jgi:carboxylesterase type B
MKLWRRNIVGIVVFAGAIPGGSDLTAALTKPVRTEGGLVAGVEGGVAGRDPGITVFRGIPFAAPPLGRLRWAAPQPPLKWTGVRAADRFGANCIQTIVDGKKPWTHEFMAHGDASEDCLFLNVWTAASDPNEKRPVLVFLHGGANTEGSGSVAVYSGAGLARKGVVMVTVNYRLGVFGFFTYKELSGNYALLDQIAALKWVQTNIAAFGGDPARVTVAGQSAGASDIALLLGSPLARGLFERAIMESGGAPGTGGGRPLAASQADGARFAEAKGAHSVEELRALPWKDLFAPVAGIRFGPVIDGTIVPAAGAMIDVPLLAGSNADENGASPQPGITAAKFRDQARQRYGDLAGEFLAAYPASTDDEACARSNEAARDRQRVLYDEWARTRTAKAPVFVYFYDHVLPGPDAGQYGSFHTSEVPYVLNSLADSDRPFTAEDRRVAETLSSYWANFAARGDPNGLTSGLDRLPHWPSTAEAPRMTMEIGDANKAIPAAGNDARFDLIRKLIALH